MLNVTDMNDSVMKIKAYGDNIIRMTYAAEEGFEKESLIVTAKPSPCANPDVRTEIDENRNVAIFRNGKRSVINEQEVNEWDNQEVYDQTVAALEAKNVPIISTFDDMPFMLGKCKITLFNTDDPVPTEKVGENDQSIGVLVETNGTRAFLAADMDDLTGDETRLAPQIGKVDLLKVGHHGCEGSSTPAFLQTLMPKICVFTTGEYDHNVLSRERIQEICHAAMYFTACDGGILALLGENGDVRCYGQIH